MNKNIESIQKEFTKQANSFEKYQSTDAKLLFSKHAISLLNLKGGEDVLEIAAGTCSFGRLFSPYVKKITEVDVTKEMLDVGRKTNEKEGITNVEYVLCSADETPFEDATFDVIASRLAFHHFTDPDSIFKEMNRLLKRKGKILIADMIIQDLQTRDSLDMYERMRDPSHARCLSEEEFISLGKDYGLTLSYHSVTDIPMNLNAWMDLTHPSEEIRKNITKAMEEDIHGGKKTGFFPYLKEKEIFFNHHWGLFVFEKN